MPYSDFTLEKVQEDFKLNIIEDQDMFSQIKEVEVNANLLENLEFKVPLALAINIILKKRAQN